MTPSVNKFKFKLYYTKTLIAFSTALPRHVLAELTPTKSLGFEQTRILNISMEVKENDETVATEEKKDDLHHKILLIIHD